MQANSDDPRLKLMQKWSQNMPQFSMQAAASRGGGDDDDDEEDDSRSVKSSYSTQSYASHASLAGMFLGPRFNGRRKYTTTKKGPKILTPAPATQGNNQPHQQNQANSNEGGKSKRNRKRKGKNAGDTEAVIVPTKKESGEVVVEEIPITKETAEVTKERAVKELTVRVKNIWKSLKDPSKYGGSYKTDDTVVTTITEFATSSNNTPIIISEEYNSCVLLLNEWQINLKKKKPTKYVTEAVKIPYLVMNFTTPDIVKDKIEKTKVTVAQYRKYLLARLTYYFARGLDGAIFQNYDKLTPEQLEQMKKDKKQKSLTEIISESNENYVNVHKIFASIEPWIIAYQKSISKAQQTAKSAGGKSYANHFGADEFGEADHGD